MQRRLTNRSTCWMNPFSANYCYDTSAPRRRLECSNENAKCPSSCVRTPSSSPTLVTMLRLRPVGGRSAHPVTVAHGVRVVVVELRQASSPARPLLFCRPQVRFLICHHAVAGSTRSQLLVGCTRFTLASLSQCHLFVLHAP